MSVFLKGKDLFSWQEGQESKSSNTDEVQGSVGQSSSKLPLASTWKAAWLHTPLTVTIKVFSRRVATRLSIFCNMPLELPATPALKYSFFSPCQALCFAGLLAGILEEDACSRTIPCTSPPVMGVQRFPSTVMHSSVLECKGQEESTIIQKWTSKAELLNCVFFYTNLPWKVFSLPKMKNKGD